jgi:uncharacterized membrane protein YsdA (DUF1294 family)
MSRHTPPEWTHAGVALACSAIITLALMLGLRLPWDWPWLIACWVAGTSVTAFAYYGFDKGRAKSGGRRVPEVVLHGIAVAGGTLGAYAGMRVFRHKTIKGPFQIFFWTVAALQGVLLAVALWRAARG